MVAAHYRRLPELLFPPGAGNHVLAITAWADESESKRDQFLCIAAYISSAKRWRRFVREWTTQIRPLPFHMVAFRNPRSKLRQEIRGDARKIEALALRISKIIRDHTIHGIVVTINPPEYEQLTTQRFRSQYGSAYAFAGMMLWEGLRIWAEDNHYRGKINFWLEEGHEHADELMQKLWAHKRNSPIQNMIGDFGFGSKVEHPPLQAADVLAYSAYETILRRKRIPAMELGKIRRLHCSATFIKERIADITKRHASESSERRAINAIERDARLAIKRQLAAEKEMAIESLNENFAEVFQD